MLFRRLSSRFSRAAAPRWRRCRLPVRAEAPHNSVSDRAKHSSNAFLLGSDQTMKVDTTRDRAGGLDLLQQSSRARDLTQVAHTCQHHQPVRAARAPKFQTARGRRNRNKVIRRLTDVRDPCRGSQVGSHLSNSSAVGLVVKWRRAHPGYRQAIEARPRAWA